MINEKTQQVKMGSKVIVTVNDTPHELEIVPPNKVDLEKNKVSKDAPLVQMILGLKEGESTQGIIASKKAEIKIQKIL